MPHKQTRTCTMSFYACAYTHSHIYVNVMCCFYCQSNQIYINVWTYSTYLYVYNIHIISLKLYQYCGLFVEYTHFCFALFIFFFFCFNQLSFQFYTRARARVCVFGFKWRTFNSIDKWGILYSTLFFRSFIICTDISRCLGCHRRWRMAKETTKNCYLKDFPAQKPCKFILCGRFCLELMFIWRILVSPSQESVGSITLTWNILIPIGKWSKSDR